MYKHATVLFLSAALFTLGVGSAQAQNVSARGLSADALQESACNSALDRIRDQVDDLENFAGQLENCNDQGKLFDGTKCTDAAGLTHQWETNASDPTKTDIVLYNNGKEERRVTIIKGRDGFDQTNGCPAGTTQK